MSEKVLSELNFAAVLGSSVHDMKNSLSIIQDLISQTAKTFQPDQQGPFGQLEFEANRMNNLLMQLLVLYKLDSAHFNLSIDEHSVLDLLDEVVAHQETLLAMQDIKLTIDCPEELFCYCDFNMISNVLGTILNNAQRYAGQNILLSARQQEQHLVFAIEDDGAGYPDIFMQPVNGDLNSVNFNTGSTGLGLYFAEIIAKMHRNAGNQGSTVIDNKSTLGGARFRLMLP